MREQTILAHMALVGDRKERSELWKLLLQAPQITSDDASCVFYVFKETNSLCFLPKKGLSPRRISLPNNKVETGVVCLGEKSNFTCFFSNGQTYRVYHRFSHDVYNAKVKSRVMV